MAKNKNNKRDEQGTIHELDRDLARMEELDATRPHTPKQIRDYISKL